MKKEMKILVGIFALVAVIFAAATLLIQPSEPGPRLAQSEGTAGPRASQSQPPSEVDASILIREDSPSLGPEDAPVTLVEYLDPECESCGAIYPYVKQILKDFEGQIRFVVRYMPYHNNSRLAAIAAEAAGRQERYWEMLDLLFERQEEWGHKHEPQTEIFVRYAEELGLDQEKFTSDLQDEQLGAKVDRDARDGEQLGVRGTPSFFVNQRPLEQLDLNILRARIQAELKP